MDEAQRALVDMLAALRFAAVRHRNQRRKGVDSAPYINHLIEVAEVLAGCGVLDAVTLRAAVLHDTLEDTETTPAELERLFGAEVRSVVEEVTDDATLPQRERKQRQIERAPNLSDRARRLKIADKISNIRDVARHAPDGWSIERRRAYVEWAARVVEGCRGTSECLERRFDAEFELSIGTLEEISEG
jgi:(p)ppGpp synthase/HD superfamily hydrolase